MADSKSSNLTGLFIAEEETLGVLPTNPVFYEREPNTYSDFGGNYTMTTRKPIKHDRQFRKGQVTDNDPTAGWNEDLTPNNMRDFMQGFLFADIREKPNTTGSAAVAATDTYTVASSTGIVANNLIFAKDFALAANNGLKVVASAAAGSVVVGDGLADESGATGTLRVVGYQFAAGDASLTASASAVSLSSATLDFTTFGLIVGEWLFIGGDTTATRFADSGDNAPFYARIGAITATTITFDKVTGTQVTDAGTGKTVQIFYGDVIKNEDDCALIKRRSYTIERQFGCGTDAEAEYVLGAVPNQLTLTVPQPAADAKLGMDLAYIGMSSTERLSTETLMSAEVGASVIAAFNEDAFVPGLDVYQSKIAVVDPTTLAPTEIVGYVSDGTLVINNNVAGNKAIGVFGNFDANIGEFAVTGTQNGFFVSVQANREIRLGSEITYHLIATRSNSAIIFDLPSIGVSNGRSTVAANTPVKIPLDMAAGECDAAYTLLTNFFAYVPTVGLSNN